MTGAIDRTHATFAEDGENLVRTEARAGSQSGQGFVSNPLLTLAIAVAP